jgi:hypothetical protein
VGNGTDFGAGRSGGAGLGLRRGVGRVRRLGDVRTQEKALLAPRGWWWCWVSAGVSHGGGV